MREHPPSLLLAVTAFTLAFGVAVAEANPTLEWQHIHDGGSQQSDMGVAVLTDPAGNVVIAGEIVSAAGSGDLLIRKLARATGDTLWSRTVTGSADNPLAVGGMVWDGAGDLLIGGTRLGCFG